MATCVAIYFRSSVEWSITPMTPMTPTWQGVGGGVGKKGRPLAVVEIQLLLA